MEDFLEEIYQKAELYTIACEISYFANYNSFFGIKEVLKEKQVLFQKLHDENNNLAIVLEKIYNNAGDRFTVSDTIEMSLLPMLNQYLKQYQCIDVKTKEDYRLTSSAHGFLTLSYKERLFHSQFDPMLEARNIVLSFYKPMKTSYSLLGCGLGYIAYQLYRISEGTVKIKVFEPNEQIAKYAKDYGVLSWIPEEDLEIIVDKDVVPFLESVDDDSVGYYIFIPELSLWIEDVRYIMSKLLIDQNTYLCFKEYREINFYQNMRNVSKIITDLSPECKNGKCIVVAGGPSLDDNIDFIRENRAKMTVISVGTSFGKLVQLGLRPDFVAVCDPTKLIMKQLDGVEEGDTKLIVATTAYWNFAKSYKGDKYLVPILQNDEESNFWKRENDLCSWSVGGTVTIFAAKIAEYLNSKEIYLIGADFAYPGDGSHATGTPGYERINTNSKIYMDVISVNGENVKAPVVLNLYKEQMQDFIQNTPNITFYNMSTGGAYIKGTLDGRDLL